MSGTNLKMSLVHLSEPFGWRIVGGLWGNLINPLHILNLSLFPDIFLSGIKDPQVQGLFDRSSDRSRQRVGGSIEI